MEKLAPREARRARSYRAAVRRKKHAETRWGNLARPLGYYVKQRGCNCRARKHGAPGRSVGPCYGDAVRPARLERGGGAVWVLLVSEYC